MSKLFFNLYMKKCEELIKCLSFNKFIDVLIVSIKINYNWIWRTKNSSGANDKKLQEKKHFFLNMWLIK
jgi:hypothetical protein